MISGKSAAPENPTMEDRTFAVAHKPSSPFSMPIVKRMQERNERMERVSKVVRLPNFLSNFPIKNGPRKVPPRTVEELNTPVSTSSKPAR